METSVSTPFMSGPFACPCKKKIAEHQAGTAEQEHPGHEEDEPPGEGPGAAP